MEAITKLEDKAVLGLRHDPTIWIAEAPSRFSKNWKPKELRWSQLLGRLKTPTITAETQAEYFKMKKADQDNIKDVGGFVGGTLHGGQRKTETVDKRYLLTFDLDTAPKDFPETMELTATYAYAIYSTHKHKPEAPRMRLIVPLDRSVDPEEYEAIARKMAEEIGLKYFDSTTCQPARLMYWPSCSRDAEYVFTYNDDKLLKADDVLAKYPDWHDVTYWPTFPDEERVQKKKTDKQQDPTKKNGLVGAFCRTYTVPQAIAEFLPDTYKPCENSDSRYTYTSGSTSGGLVIYDDGLFCYSNHATDPAHGMDLNAFDLVRIHKFAELDAEAAEGTPVAKMPSYLAMIDLCRGDENVIKTIDAERQADIKELLEDATEAPEPEQSEAPKEKDWRTKLTRNKIGAIENTVTNLWLILTHDKTLKGIRYNELARTIDITAPVPWEKKRRLWVNDDDARLYMYICNTYTKFFKSDLLDALTAVAHRRSFNPIAEYLKGLPEWDGVTRVETLLSDYLGAPDDKYTREVMKRWLLAAVSRVFRPGCKFDYVPVIIGPGGIGKSTLIAKLGGDWFNDGLSFEDMRDKTAAEKLQGYWLMEIGELKGMRKSDVESVKSFISRQVDIYRPSYGRHVENRPRTSVIVGTSNVEDFLKDTTGNRRFWPVTCSGRSVKRAWDLTKDDVAQIWAEVMFYYDDVGDTQLTLPEELAKIAEQKQLDALEHDDRQGAVQEFLERELPILWDDMDYVERRAWLDDDKHDVETVLHQRTEVCIMEIWAECLRMNPATIRRTDSDDIARILLQLGWIRENKVHRFGKYGPQRGYKKS